MIFIMSLKNIHKNMKRKGFFKAALRGLLKSLPFGNVIDEVVQNTKANIESEILDNGIQSKEQPHNWISITIQFIGIAAIIYAFVSKQITIEQFIDLIN